MRDVRIAFIGGFAFTPKGTMRARAHPLAAALVKAGHEVTIFLPPYDNPQECGREWEQEGVHIKNVGATISVRNEKEHLQKREYPRLLIGLIREVHRYHPDVVHVFKPKGFAGAAGAYFMSKRAPVVLDCDDWEGWGGWNEVKQYPWLVKEYIDRQERWLIRRAKAVTVASRMLEERAVKLRKGSDGVFYLPNCGASSAGREMQASVRATSQTETRRFLGLPEGLLVLFSGHKDDAESARITERAVANIAAEMPVTLVVVGDAMRSSPVEIAGQNLVRFSQLSYLNFLRVVWACDVAVFPYAANSIHRAKCSARILDYMAMGKPVLTSAVGQNLEYIVNEESGILVATEDECRFHVELKRLLLDPELRTRLGANAQKRIAEKYRWDGDAVEQCLRAYERALENANPLIHSRTVTEKSTAQRAEF